MISTSRGFIVRAMILVFTTVQCLMVPIAHAGMIDTGQVLAAENRAEHKASMTRLLSRDDAADALNRFGVAPEQINERLDRLSDSELAALAERADELPAGGVAGTLVLILLLLIILDLLGVTNIFPAIQTAN